MSWYNKNCKHCHKYGFVDETHHRIHEKWCDHKNPTEFETKSGIGIKKLSVKCITNNWEYIMKLLKGDR